MSPRLYHCQCESDGRTSFSPLAELLQERSSPELVYLETKFAALVSYGLTVELLKEVLPIGQELSTTAIRQRISRTAQRLEDELGEEQHMFIGGCQRDWDQLPDPAAPLIVGIDGGYVHAKDQQSRAEGWFEVIVGKSMSQDGESSKCFGFVNRYDTKPKRRLFEMLKSQGMQMNQAVTFLSDGGDTVRDLQLYLNPQAEHLLDWFHISMRLTVMSQLAKSIEADDQPNLSAEIEKDLKRLKWNLWHGNVHKALQIVKDLKARHKTYTRDDWFAQIRYAIITTNPDQKLPPLSGRLEADTEEKALEVIYGAIVRARSSNDGLAVQIIAAPIRHIFYARH